MEHINLGIVAHVDAGKTSLTERLLFEVGVTDRVGRVDRGDTQTDIDSLEQQRGITINSAVVSFVLGGIRINLIDTPGHSDFVAEVERALSVLDGAILVLSAVEGVQAQTRMLMRALARQEIPTVLFVNKVDRAGARTEGVLAEIAEGLTPDAIALNAVASLGTRQATVTARAGDHGWRSEALELVADHDKDLLRRYVEDTEPISDREVRRALAVQSRRAVVHPVLFGSAMTGAGVSELMDAIPVYLRTAESDAGCAESEPLRATVFKVEWPDHAEKVAYVRLRAGTVSARDRVPIFRLGPSGVVTVEPEKATAVQVCDDGTAMVARTARAGEIARVQGLRSVKIGDQLGSPDGLHSEPELARPGLATTVTVLDEAARPRLHAALHHLAEQDPLIDVRLEGLDGQLTVSLYGEVQKEVLADRLRSGFGIEAEFSRTRAVYVERPTAVGTRVDLSFRPFAAGVGLRVDPARPGSGVSYRVTAEVGALLGAFHRAIEETVRSALRQGLYGWEVTDCVITLTDSAYDSVASTAGDFRDLTPLVLLGALARAGTVVCEPMSQFELGAPVESLSAAIRHLARAGAALGEPTFHGATCRVEGTVPTSEVHDISQQLPGFTQGRGSLLTRPAGYRPMKGRFPVRPRSDGNPLDRSEYLLYLKQGRRAG